MGLTGNQVEELDLWVDNKKRNEVSDFVTKPQGPLFDTSSFSRNLYK